MRDACVRRYSRAYAVALMCRVPQGVAGWVLRATPARVVADAVKSNWGCMDQLLQQPVVY